MLRRAVEVTPANYAAGMDLILLRFFDREDYQGVAEYAPQLLDADTRIGRENVVKLEYCRGAALLKLHPDNSATAEEALLHAVDELQHLKTRGKRNDFLKNYERRTVALLGEIYKDYPQPMSTYRRIELHLRRAEWPEAKQLLDLYASECADTHILQELRYFSSLRAKYCRDYKAAATTLLQLYVETVCFSSLPNIRPPQYQPTELFQSVILAHAADPPSEQSMETLAFLTEVFLLPSAKSLLGEHRVSLVIRFWQLCSCWYDATPDVSFPQVQLPRHSQVTICAWLLSLLDDIEKKQLLDPIRRHLCITTENSLEQRLAFGVAPAQQLQKLRSVELELMSHLVCGDLDSTDAIEVARRAIDEGRSLLDYVFFAFCERNFTSVDRAMFPRVPSEESFRQKHNKGGSTSSASAHPAPAKSTESRLHGYLERQLNLVDFKEDFAFSFNYLLSIQPRENPQFAWLHDFYNIRNVLEHKGAPVDERLIDYGPGQLVDVIQLAQRVIRGVYKILVDFYEAAKQYNAADMTTSITLADEDIQREIIIVAPDSAMFLRHAFETEKLKWRPRGIDTVVPPPCH